MTNSYPSYRKVLREGRFDEKIKKPLFQAFKSRANQFPSENGPFCDERRSPRVYVGTTDLIPYQFHRCRLIPRSPVKPYHFIQIHQKKLGVKSCLVIKRCFFKGKLPPQKPSIQETDAWTGNRRRTPETPWIQAKPRYALPSTEKIGGVHQGREKLR